jgi:pre-mRNA-splicing factor 18
MVKAMAGAKAMDLLKSALAERQAKAQKVIHETGQKWVRRSEIVEKQKEEYFENKRREEEKSKADEEAQLENLREHLTRRQKQKEEEEPEQEIPAHILDEALLGDDDAEPPIGLSEVIDRLRELGQPITLFGETDMQRYKRLRKTENESLDGKKNPDLIAIEQMHQSQQQLQLKNAEEDAVQENSDDEKEADQDGEGDRSDKSDTDEEPDPEGNEDKSDTDEEPDPEGKEDKDKSDTDEEPEAPAGFAASSSSTAKVAESGDKKFDPVPDKHPDLEDLPKEKEISLETMDRCDMIRGWARKALKAWEKELADRPEEDKVKAIYKTEIAAHRQVRRDVRPLQKRLRLYILDDFLLDKIHHIVSKADLKLYMDAQEAYLDLSIGKAAWPVGIGCGGSMLMEDAIGLHDRFNRNNQVKDIAFALNDDVTRKFVQALKRLMSKAQQYWPPDDPSNRCG